MNIHCMWDTDGRLLIKSGHETIGFVNNEFGDDPVLNLTEPGNPTLTFTEIEHVMDNWHHMPKPNMEGVVMKGDNEYVPYSAQHKDAVETFVKHPSQTP